MRHYFCWFIALGLLAIPSAAAACWPRWGNAYYSAPAYGVPMYAMPVASAPQFMAPRFMAPRFAAPQFATPMYAAPPVVYVGPPVWQQAMPTTPLPPPRVETTPKLATPTPAPGVDTEVPKRAPIVVPDPVRPAAGSDAPPKKDAAPKKVDPPPFPLDLKFPEITIPKNLQPAPKPVVKDPDPAAIPRVPAVGAGKDPLLPAIPVPAPAPEPSIPPPGLPLPNMSKRDPLPSLTLPPDTPVKPAAQSGSTSRSSPLTGTGGARELEIKVFPTAGEHAAGIYRTVGFFNHTNQELALTIEGRAVTLPARSYLHAQLASSFTWGFAAKPAARETVPEGAAGLDVVFRE